MSRRARFLLLGIVAVGLVVAAYFTDSLPGVGDDAPAVRGRLGPTGSDTEGYVAQKRAHLEAVGGRAPDQEAAALVLLNDFVDVGVVGDLASGGDVLRLYVRQEGQEPGSLPTLGSLEEAQTDLGGPCGCVFAFVVEDTTLGSLLAMQQDPVVRLADVPDPPVVDLGGWELVPILPPEEG